MGGGSAALGGTFLNVPNDQAPRPAVVGRNRFYCAVSKASFRRWAASLWQERRNKAIAPYGPEPPTAQGLVVGRPFAALQLVHAVNYTNLPSESMARIHSSHNMAAVCHQDTKIEIAASAAISLVGI
jgi:hypothetical protein